MAMDSREDHLTEEQMAETARASLLEEIYNGKGAGVEMCLILRPLLLAGCRIVKHRKEQVTSATEERRLIAAILETLAVLEANLRVRKTS